jgi:tetratricopeptide (TPR) repeat protein
MRKNNFVEAVKDYDQSLRLKPDNWRALFERGLARTQLGLVEGALADFEAALAVAGTHQRNSDIREILEALERARRQLAQARDNSTPSRSAEPRRPQNSRNVQSTGQGSRMTPESQTDSDFQASIKAIERALDDLKAGLTFMDRLLR